jgi:hypothetical protein
MIKAFEIAKEKKECEELKGLCYSKLGNIYKIQDE